MQTEQPDNPYKAPGGGAEPERRLRRRLTPVQVSLLFLLALLTPFAVRFLFGLILP